VSKTGIVLNKKEGEIIMNEKEAQKVVEILLFADTECCNCAGELVWRFIHAFPEYSELVKKMYEDRYDMPLDTKLDYQ